MITTQQLSSRSWRALWGSVRLRITVVVALLVGVTLSVAGFVLVNRIEAALVNDVHEEDRDTLELLRAAFEDSESSEAVFLRPANAELGLVYLEVPGVGTVELHLYGHYFFVQGPGVDALAPDKTAADADDRVPLFGQDPPPSDVRGDEYAVTEYPIDTPEGQVTLTAATSLDTVSESVSKVRGALWFSIPVLVAFIAAVAWVMTGRALGPVNAITRRVEEITGTTLHERVPEPAGHDEVAHLARTMNSMLDRLETSASRQRQFVSDASHELRSPVASIRAQLEVALLHPETAEWDDVARAVLDEDERLEQVVSDLLTLARLDEGTPRTVAELDLDDIIHEEVARVRRVGCNVGGVLAGRVLGNRDDLTSMVRNLLDNAARHAAGTVAVSLSAGGGEVVLVVDDDGSGIPEADRQRVFERFTRLEEGRSRDSGGTGLGLAVVKRVVESHGGTVAVADSPLGGARVVVRLPAA